MKKFKYTINGITYRVEVNSLEGNVAEVDVNGTTYKVELEKESSPSKVVASAPSRPAPRPVPPAAPTPEVSTPQVAQAAPSGGAPVLSPLPGVILDIACQVGDEVKRGQKLLVLEAMKMENDIKADRDGRVLAISVNKGDSVQEGATLITLG